MLTAAHVINRLPTTVLNFQSLAQAFAKFYPIFSVTNNLVPKIFGCVAFVHLHSQHRDKLDLQALRCFFVGYSSTKKCYECCNPLTRKFYVSTDVTFVEDSQYFYHPNLQGEMTFMEVEDKDKDPFLLHLPVPKLSSSVPIQSKSVHVHSKLALVQTASLAADSEVTTVPVSGENDPPSSPTTQNTNHTSSLQVHSRKKRPPSQPTHFQSSYPSQ